MEDNRRSSRNVLLKKIDQRARKLGIDFVTLVHMHLSTIQEWKEEKEQKNKTSERAYDYVMAEIFLSKIEMYPSRRFVCKVNGNSDWPVPILPTDVFVEFPEEYRTRCFYEFLKVGDMLDVRVIDALDCKVTASLNTNYQLKVVRRCSSIRVVEDLNIIAKLPKKVANKLLLGPELLPIELVRVAVCDISAGEILVTVSGKNLDGSIIQYLGRVPEEILPPYVDNPPDPENYPTYSSYLKSFPQFGNPHLLCEIYSGFGFDPQMSYSFFPEYDGLKCADEEIGQNLLKKAKLNDSKQYLFSALNKSREGNFNEALKFIHLALDSCPAGDPLRYEIYKNRGSIYEDIDFRGKLKQTACEWITISSKGDTESMKHLSILASKIAKKQYFNHNLKEAVYFAETSLKWNADNSVPAALLACLRKKHPEAFTRLDDISYEELKQRQKIIEAKLQKEKIPVPSSTTVSHRKKRRN